MEIVIILILLTIGLFIFEKLMRKWLNIEKVELSETPAANIDRWGRGVILVLALCTIPLSAGAEEMERMIWFFVVYLFVLNLFQAYLQWKYIKGSKEYWVTLASLPIGIGAFLSIIFFYY
ncbi:DUF4181 domain-containing protein [Planomicrobium sp. CPCC 101110]|uniref:DUF4181 domain-containing protein n=1 Tax=Planomicrobium sp. CPCC 101110 TaxID=2599619 RepID=UPI0011B416B9|nr:DUF4181 domain-containing protein [Planomicrobium sp. CPCC 101110]TWT27262.1 DUF4181 domain-containing protein [Planomicrobium sp. CPCC 101110]